MSLQVKGIQELIDHFDKMNDKKIPKKALKRAANYVLEVEQKVVKETHDTYSKDEGNKYLRSLPVRQRKGRSFVDIGIKGDGANWDKVKGVYFNHYGFWHNGWNKKNTRKNREKGTSSSGVYIAGSRWMDRAYDESKVKALEMFREDLEKGLGI